MCFYFRKRNAIARAFDSRDSGWLRDAEKSRIVKNWGVTGTNELGFIPWCSSEMFLLSITRWSTYFYTTLYYTREKIGSVVVALYKNRKTIFCTEKKPISRYNTLFFLSSKQIFHSHRKISVISQRPHFVSFSPSRTQATHPQPSEESTSI